MAYYKHEQRRTKGMIAREKDVLNPLAELIFLKNQSILEREVGQLTWIRKRSKFNRGGIARGSDIYC